MVDATISLVKRPFSLQQTCSAFGAFALLLTSCAIEEAARPLQPTKFLTSTGVNIEQRIARLPFEHSWRDPKLDISKYKHIVIRPVTVKFLDTESWERSKSQEIPDQIAFEKRSRKLAEHFTKRLNISFSDPICLFYKINNPSKPNTLVLEVALTEAHFPDPEVAPLDVPYCGFEAKVKDGRTGKILVTAADRRGPDLHISENNTHITDNREICAIWARQLMEASNKEIFANVRRKLITIE